ncbi:MAG: GNAT family N-acetyltransferase [Leptospirales bacterium]
MEQISYVVALPSMAPDLARMWKRLIDEEAPPLMEAGPGGEDACSGTLRKMLEDTERCAGFVATENGQRVGFVLGYTYTRPYGHPARAGQILHWYVDPSFRGQGVGQCLYDHLMEWFVRKRIEIVEVMARDEPDRDQSWCSRGFTVTLRVYAKRLPALSFSR